MYTHKTLKYKAILVDVDGTLMVATPDGVPTKKVLHAMDRASKFLHVGLATSRCILNTAYILDMLKLSGPSILEGGACIYDAAKRKSLSEQVLTPENLKPLQSLLIDSGLEFEYCDNVGDHMKFPKSGKVPKKAFMVFSQGVDNDHAKRITLQLTANMDAAIHTTNSWTKGKTDILITHPQATKQHGILEVAKILGIETHEIIGVGDGNNDFPLLMACGLKIAMGNAGDDLKAIADYVAPDVSEDGLAHVIEKFILN